MWRPTRVKCRRRGLRLHPLEPKKAGRYAVWVDENYRVTFEFEGADTSGVDYEDYH